VPSIKQCIRSLQFPISPEPSHLTHRRSISSFRCIRIWPGRDSCRLRVIPAGSKQNCNSISGYIKGKQSSDYSLYPHKVEGVVG
jgi:hypothetical protein